MNRKFREKYLKKIIVFILLLTFLVSLILLVISIGPEQIVQIIGVNNGYLIVFIASFFGGLSSFTSIFPMSLLATFLAGGLNPILLGLLAGTSLVIGDSLMFYIGRKGRELVVGKWDKELENISNFIKKKKMKKFIPFFSYFYLSFTPFPNDLLLLFLASIEYPPKKTYKLIILGDYTHVFLWVILFSQGIRILG